LTLFVLYAVEERSTHHHCVSPLRLSGELAFH
jgi:hypothetical protein